GFEVAVEDFDENEVLRLLVGVNGNVAGQGENLAILQDRVVLDDQFDVQVGGALAELVGVALGVGQCAVEDKVSLVDLAQQRLALGGAERAADGGGRGGEHEGGGDRHQPGGRSVDQQRQHHCVSVAWEGGATRWGKGTAGRQAARGRLNMAYYGGRRKIRARTERGGGRDGTACEESDWSGGPGCPQGSFFSCIAPHRHPRRNAFEPSETQRNAVQGIRDSRAYRSHPPAASCSRCAATISAGRAATSRKFVPIASQ